MKFVEIYAYIAAGAHEGGLVGQVGEREGVPERQSKNSIAAFYA